MNAAFRILPAPCQRLLGRIQASPLAYRLMHGSFWSVAGSVTSRFFALFAAILAARILGKASYGELGIIQSTVGMFGAFAGFAMGTTGSKFVAEFRQKDPVKAGRIIALSSIISWTAGGVLGIALVILAPWLCTTSLSAPHLTHSLQASALLLLLSGVNGAQNGVLSGFEAFKRIAIVSSVTGALTFPLVVGGAWLMDLPGLIWGMIIAQAIGCVLNFYAMRQEMARHRIPVTYATWTAELPVLWHFALPALLGNLVITPVTWICTTLLVRQPDGFEHMGAFNAANQWFNVLMWLPYMLGGVAMPMLAERFGANDRASSAKLLATSVKINLGISLPIVIIGCFASPWIMAAYGNDFRREWATLAVTLASAGLLAVQIPVGQLIAASGRMWSGFLLNLGWGIVFVICTVMLVNDHGALGLAWARTIAYFIQGIAGFVVAGALIRNLGRNQPETKPANVEAAGPLAR